MSARSGACLLACLFFLIWSVPASRASDDWTFYPFDSLFKCDHTCAGTVFAGPLLRINLRPEAKKWETVLVGGTLSRILVEYRKDFDIEGELGVAQRVGALNEEEVWAAFYFRWKTFPWNNYITTTAAISTGVNYASAIDPYEVGQSRVGHGSNLLHYLAPEVTFALPQYPDWQLVARIHHRSGGALIWGDHGPFGGVYGASQFFVMGVRHWF